MAATVESTPLQRGLRWALALGYVGFVIAGFLTPLQPRVFWTMLLPIVPLAIVLMGFSNWRRICPLALFGEAGRFLNRGVQRKVPPVLERTFFPLTFAILLAMLVLRLVATNGDGIWLSGLLVGLALAAIVANWVYTGKTWCNFFCPVGLVERIYTEPNSLPTTPNSQCSHCTACKKNCPDIDQENAYWKDMMAPARRFAIFSFPGLVAGFYTYYWLRAGDWAAYFDGRWTQRPADSELVLGPGFFFAPQVPAVIAATLTLAAFSVVSYFFFVGFEALLGRLYTEPARHRHLALAVASFSAFSLFYFWAGAPSLRRLEGGTRSVAFVAPVVGTLFLIQRWRRTREHYIGDQGARRLLRSWPFDEPPPSDPAEVYGWIQASRHAKEKDSAAYESTVRGMIADGLVTGNELRLLDGVRKQLGISEQEHEKILERLSEEERHLFEAEGRGVEQRVQLDGYQSALQEALLRNPSESEITELRESYGVSREDHENVLERMRGASGALLSRARGQLDRTLSIRNDLATLAAGESTPAQTFLCTLLRKEQAEALDRVLELLEIAGDGPMIQALRGRLFSPDPKRRALALDLLAEACHGADELRSDLEPLLAGEVPDSSAADPAREFEVLMRFLAGKDPFLRAGAVWAAVGRREPELQQAIADARKDPHALVGETAERFGAPQGAGRSDSAGPLSAIETMAFLHGVPLFDAFEPEDLYELTLFAFEEVVDEGETLCEIGDAGTDAFFVLLSGRVSAELPKVEGTETRTEVVEPGGVVGELSVLDGTPRDVTVRAVDGPVRVLRVPGVQFRSGLMRRPRVTRSLFASLAGRIRRLAGQVHAD